jgi:methyl-galactoside transport system ATP-binding protein
MEEILRISDEVTVMRDGKHVATEKAKDLTMDKIIRLMVGRELTERFPPKNNKIGEVVLKVDRLTTRYAPIRDVSFELRSGEIVGVAGLGGAGRTELLESIFGLCEKKSGSIRLHGKEISNRTPREAKKNGFALLTEERRANGIFGILDITDNTVISGLSKYRAAGLFLNESKMKKDTEWSIKSMRIKTPSRATKIGTLSGGNQQKVILGRWLLTEPEVLLLDEPTRGIDVGAKYEIYQLMISLAEAGKCIMMVSSEMPELLGVCDRILVMSGGRLAGELLAKSATQEKIMELASRFA